MKIQIQNLCKCLTVTSLAFDYRLIRRIGLAVFVALAWLSPNAIEAQSSGETPDGFYYRVTAFNTVELLEYVGTNESVTIPPTLQVDLPQIGPAISTNLPVTSIWEDAFYGDINLTSVVVSTDVTEIGLNAFGHCSSLTNVIIGNSVLNIEGYVFQDCTSLAGIAIPSSVTNIGAAAFEGCSRLNNFVVPGGIHNLSANIFSYCTGLTNIIVGTNVFDIESGAFEGCTNLISLAIPESVTNFDAFAFGGCSGFRNFIIPDGSVAIGDDVFSNCFNLTNIVIGSGVISIGNGTFQSCSNLTTITIPNNVASIGDHAFSGCSSLTNIAISASVTNIGTGAFDAPDLMSITVAPQNPAFTVVGGVLMDKNQATILQLPRGQAILNYTVPDTVTSIGANAFAYCFSLTNITISGSVTNIGDFAFANCPNLQTINFEGNAPELANGVFTEDTIRANYPASATGWTELSMNMQFFTFGGEVIFQGSTSDGFQFVIFDGSVNIYGYNGSNALLIIPATIQGEPVIVFDSSYNTNVTSIYISDSVTNISFSLSGFSSLTNISVGPENLFFSSVNGILFNKDQTTLLQFPPAAVESNYTIPTSVTNLGDYAFQECYLTNIVVPDTVIGIGVGTFFGDSYLTNIIIPESVASVGASAFTACFSLAQVFVSDNLTNIGSGAFSYCYNLTNITVNAQNPAYSSTDGILFDKNQMTLLAYPAAKPGSAYSIQNSVTVIGDSAFGGCFYLTNITVPDSVTNMGFTVFDGCSSLMAINVDPRNQLYRSTDGVLFDESQDLLISYPMAKTASRYTVPETVTSIGVEAFSGC